MTEHVNSVIDMTPVRSSLRKILSNHGERGFVNILKQAKAWGYQIVAGNTEFTLPWYRVKRYKGYRYPYRLKPLFTPLIDAVVSVNYLEIQRRLSYINVYQAIRGPLDPPEKVKEPVYGQPVCRSPKTEKWFVLLTKVLEYFHPGPRIPDPPVTEVKPTGQSVAITPVETGSYARYVSRGAPGSPLSKQLKGILMLRGWDVEPDLLYQGNLVIIGDSGGKSRLILVGNPVVQQKLKPLQEYLMSILRSLPTDCTFDQVAGHKYIVMSQLAEKPLWAVDLKDATWNFPWALQELVLEKLGQGKFVQYFKLPVSDDGKLVKVAKGQAMGLNPSFPLFSLTHNLMLFAMCKWLGLDPLKSFRVLGDDVVLGDQRLRDLYQSFCEDFDIPISHHKCLSGHACEFAGKIFLDGRDVTPIRWRELNKDSLSSLFYPYKKILKDKVFRLITDKTAFLTLGGLPVTFHGLGIQDFDSKYPVTRRHLRLREGILLSQYLNFGKANVSGSVTELPQYEVDTGLHPLGYPSYYLRTLSRYLSVEKKRTPQWGLVPYLGSPLSFSRQVGIDIPLLPAFRPGKTKPWFLRLKSVTWLYGSSRNRKESYERCKILTENLFELRDSFKESEKENAPSTTQRAEEALRHYSPGLLSGGGQ
jgi:hypothetical protein